ncbi:LOW QUALITY PROTEIN: hypothetical protein Cgig2_020372 [Carnegiea gigantea]|uniref:Protein FAR1-RELATED SEQUENCE n=1 Tax=Carnegiea gigantea TaxID=171969 RepID=A0A9Q1KDW9_9CARY|nr:LOW QUALITY PROTEIN: hypothetical protein Cgig2_020372 [Carnegiea gigantea]
MVLEFVKINMIKKNNKIVRRDLSCHRGRKKPVKVIDTSKDQTKRESSRCGCNAHVRINLRRVFEIFSEEWHVPRFVKQHNHELLLPHETHLLPCNRVITAEDEEKMLLHKEAGLSIDYSSYGARKKVEHSGLPFIEKDIRNLFMKVKKMIAHDDAMGLIESVKLAKEENIKFQYACTIDEDRRLEHLFWCHVQSFDWCHVQSFDWYHNYRDVVIFDTTYKVNAYNMPRVIFMGISNHENTILFRCALLHNETTSTFKWLMKTFVQALRKPPKTILNSPEEFEHNWPLTIEKYNLQNYKHVKGLYQSRHFWAPAYLRDYMDVAIKEI